MGPLPAPSDGHELPLEANDAARPLFDDEGPRKAAARVELDPKWYRSSRGDAAGARALRVDVRGSEVGGGEVWAAVSRRANAATPTGAAPADVTEAA